jgi:acyl carrier protein phosphodiesterase
LNFLAHTYLSFNDPQILVGNIISDFVKGKAKFNYPTAIQNGITLHRLIDEFTDNHIATKNAKFFFKQELGLYAGAFVDIVYDYFLANDIAIFKNENALQEFATTTYKMLDDNVTYLPKNFQLSFTSMKKHNWLINYKRDEGIKKSFEGLTQRARYINKNHKGFTVFLENKIALEICYNNFFEELSTFSFQQYTQLINL